MIKTAALLGKDWEDVWAMPVLLFLNLICYQIDKSEHEKREQKKWVLNH